VVFGPGRDCSQCFLVKAPVRLWALHVVLVPQNLFVHIWQALRLVSNDQSLLPKLLLQLDLYLEGWVNVCPVSHELLEVSLLVENPSIFTSVLLRVLLKVVEQEVGAHLDHH
jgi:hypothetical protein